MFRRTIILAIIAVGFVLQPAGAAPPTVGELASHNAVYTLALDSIRSGSGIQDASGHMSSRFADTCDGWTTETRSILDITDAQDTALTTRWDFLSWESKDGLDYRFRVRSSQNSKIIEAIDGTAHLRAVGEEGEVRFTSPEAATFSLPRGTLFPTQHTMALIAHAVAGGKILALPVFNGSVVGPPFFVNAILGHEIATSITSESSDPLLTATPSWRIGLAYFKTNDEDPTPYHEMKVRYHLNGVAEEVRQDFGVFSLNARLKEMKVVSKPDC